MAKSKTDTFANVAALDITESGANTQTNTKFAFPFSIMDKMALIINRVEYEFANLNTVFAAAADQIIAGIITASTTSLIDPTDAGQIDVIKLTRNDYGAAANAEIIQQPFIKDFASLPGGGLLVAPAPLFGSIMGVSAGAAGRVKIKMFYTYVELSTDEYWQLVESRRIISS